MKISSAFNRYMHAVLNDFYNQLYSIQIVFIDNNTGEVKRMIDDATGRAFTIYKNEDFSDMDDLKQLLKLLNINYPRDDNGIPVSTTKIENADLLQHVLTIEEIAGINGIELSHLKAERDRFMKEYEKY